MKTLFLLLFLFVPTLGQAELYFSPIIGEGTEENPYRAHHAGTFTFCLDLRPDRHAMLCRSDAIPSEVGIIRLPGTRGETLTALQRAALGVLARVGTLNDLMGELAPRLALRAGRDSYKRIVLGGTEYWSALSVGSWWNPRALFSWLIPDSAWAAQSYTEDFNCADAASLTCDLTWSQHQGILWAILSNRASVTNTVANQYARSTSALDTDDMAVGATLSTFTRGSATSIEIGPYGRKANDGTNTFYACTARDVSGTLDFHVWRNDAGVVTSLASSSTITPTVGQIIELRVINDQYACYVNGLTAIAPTTDGSPITGNVRGGVAYRGSGSATLNAELDNWYIQDVTSFLSIRRRPPVLFQ